MELKSALVVVALFLGRIQGCYCWDQEDLDLFDLVEEVGQSFYEVLQVDEVIAFILLCRQCLLAYLCTMILKTCKHKLYHFANWHRSIYRSRKLKNLELVELIRTIDVVMNLAANKCTTMCITPTLSPHPSVPTYTFKHSLL